MNDTKYYLDMFRDDILNSILNAPTDEATISYLTDCLNEAYDRMIDTLKSE